MVGDQRARVLDVGCGNGAFAEMLHERGHEVFAIDRHLDAVAVLPERLGTRLHVVGQVESLPYLSCHFDVVTASQSLHRFAPGLALTEMARVPRPAAAWPWRTTPVTTPCRGSAADRADAAGRSRRHEGRLRSRFVDASPRARTSSASSGATSATGYRSPGRACWRWSNADRSPLDWTRLCATSCWPTWAISMTLRPARPSPSCCRTASCWRAVVDHSSLALEADQDALHIRL